MLELGTPWALALLPLPWLAMKLLPPHRQRVSALRVPFFERIVAAVGADAQAGALVMGRGKWQMACAILAWCLLVLGLARPEWVGDPIVRTEAARDVMLAIDLSGSMDNADFEGADGETVRRMDGVRRVVDRFVAAREHDRIGLIVFGDRAYIQLPFTRDLDTARALVALMEVGMAGPRTAIGDAIGLAIHAFESSELEEKVLILLTDGTDTASKMSPLNAADIAAANGIEIYTVGIGDTEATGEDRVDFEALQAIAEGTGGQFFDAAGETGLDDVYQRIDAIAVADVRTQSWRPRDSLVHWPAAAAVMVSLLGYAGLLISARRRVPS